MELILKKDIENQYTKIPPIQQDQNATKLPDHVKMNTLDQSLDGSFNNSPNDTPKSEENHFFTDNSHEESKRKEFAKYYDCEEEDEDIQNIEIINNG